MTYSVFILHKKIQTSILFSKNNLHKITLITFKTKFGLHIGVQFLYIKSILIKKF